MKCERELHKQAIKTVVGRHAQDAKSACQKSPQICLGQSVKAVHTERGHKAGGGGGATRKKMADSTFGLHYKAIGISEISVLREVRCSGKAVMDEAD